MRNRKTRTALAAAAVLLLALAACSPKQGPAGKVTGKDRDWKSSTKTYEYELTTRAADGGETEFKAGKSDYDASAYPKCTEVR